MRPSPSLGVLAVLVAAYGCPASHQPSGPADGRDAAAQDAGADADAEVSCPPDATPDPGAPYGLPEDFSRHGCAPGSLRGLDAAGEWIVYTVGDREPGGPDDPVLQGSFLGRNLYDRLRLTGDCRALEAEMPAEDPAQAFLGADDLLVRFEPAALADVFAFDACGRTEDGRLWGHWVVCFDGRCPEGHFLAERLERIEGEDERRGLALVGEWSPGDDAPNLAVRLLGSFAVVARGRDGIRVIDLADPGAPREVGRGLSGENIGGLDVVGDRWILATPRLRGPITILDVSNPAAPSGVATFPEPREDGEDWAIGDVAVAWIDDGRTIAWVAELNHRGRVSSWDLSDPRTPVWLGELDFSGCQADYLEATPERLYVGCFTNDVYSLVLDGPLAVDSHAAWSGGHARDLQETVTSNGERVVIVADADFGGGVRILRLDEDNWARIAELAHTSLREQVGAAGVLAREDRVWVAHLEDGVRLLDVSDPNAPAEIAHFDTWDWTRGQPSAFEGALSIDVDDDRGLVVVADRGRGLLVLREE